MTKTFIRFYTIADYEEEETWLREQSQRGWKLKKMTPPCFYVFEECEPEDVIYRLDFKNQEAEPEYLQMFADFGWEYAGKCIGWFYFRKPASEMESEEDSEIFSDNQSKVDMLQKIISRRMLPIMIIFLCCVVPNIAMNHMDSVGRVLDVIFILMGVFYIYLILHCGIKLHNLKKKYGESLD